MKALTASDLRTGDVVYWTATAAWSRDINEAALMDDDACAEALASAKKQETQVVGAYLIGMEARGVPVAREAMRENIRARGPTIHPQFGKQTG
ncbi:MAG: DUF2849 domain-containing protein [Caulobacterales bacterium]